MTTRDKAIQIFKAAVSAVQPEQLIPAHLHYSNNTLQVFNEEFDLTEPRNIYVIGAGKACAAMAKSVEDILGNRITAGIVITKYAHCIPLSTIRCREAEHPVPDEKGLAATAETIELLQQAGVNDIIICLISGGASALWIDIPDGACLADVQMTFRLLLNSGACIDEFNTVRKHISAIKGGQLLRYAPDSNWFSLIISDVPGDNLSVIASGPTVPDTSNFFDVQGILEKYGLADKLPVSVARHIRNGLQGSIPETPKNNDPVFLKVQNKIIGSNHIALDAAAAKAKDLGYAVPLQAGKLDGDAALIAREIIHSCGNYTGHIPACFLYGGETTVAVTRSGKGGRNQHLALSAVCVLASERITILNHSITLLAAGTDGTDGPTDAAGAIADADLLVNAGEQGLDPGQYLYNQDAYHFFEAAGGLLKTGATQTNVMDLVVVIVE
ncbi:glycerate kinase type-2 family protein [Flavihumibacter profundi]|uniref:glycerate kinase type-2 family protein n=1 Tax=Flavihumibacter profundi TaxID=2716883 RepID=UPI001CC7F863|nr:DUF4147 domain-containing protein [Flavihumibacter profundi]MBZ5856989.1 DUF4147 domain-containing protein [Flavihumibacter profundi]